MDFRPLQLLLVHGSIIILLGLLAGFSYWWVIIRKYKQEISRAWCVAHVTITLFGVLMLIVGLLDAFADMNNSLRFILHTAFIVSGYSFAFALIVGALIGRRALLPSTNILDVVLFSGHLLGAAGAFIGMCLLLYGFL